MTVYLNRIGSAVPAHDIHAPFVAFARTLLTDDRARSVFDRMAERSGIAHRFSPLRAGNLAAGEVDAGGFYRRGAFPSTAARMALYETAALELALRAVSDLELGDGAGEITHLIVASCTGFTAPGLDLQLAERLGLRPDVERSIIGFMGCSAAVPALRAARHAVQADPTARVMVVNLELCTLHLQETADIETVLSFLLFGDGATAALVTADPTGMALGDFRAMIVPDSQDLITWRIGDQGFDMHLSGKVPGRIAQFLREFLAVAGRGDPGDRPVGGAWRRPYRAGRGGNRSAPATGNAALFARRAGGIRQHVLGHGHVRAAADAAGRCRRRPRLCHGVRPRDGGRNLPLRTRRLTW